MYNILHIPSGKLWFLNGKYKNPSAEELTNSKEILLEHFNRLWDKNQGCISFDILESISEINYWIFTSPWHDTAIKTSKDEFEIIEIENE